MRRHPRAPLKHRISPGFTKWRSNLRCKTTPSLCSAFPIYIDAREGGGTVCGAALLPRIHTISSLSMHTHAYVHMVNVRPNFFFSIRFNSSVYRGTCSTAHSLATQLSIGRATRVPCPTHVTRSTSFVQLSSRAERRSSVSSEPEESVWVSGSEKAQSWTPLDRSSLE